MRMSERYQYILLCEDRQTEQFLLNILKLQDIPERKIRVETATAGVGSAEAFVRKTYPRFLEMIRRQKYNHISLIVCTDADRYTVEERKNTLEEYCVSYTPPVKGRGNKESVMIWIPKRSIENWIHYFRESGITEDDVFPHGGKPEKCKEEAKRMLSFLQEQVNYDQVLTSLLDAKTEYDTLCRQQLG